MDSSGDTAGRAHESEQPDLVVEVPADPEGTEDVAPAAGIEQLAGEEPVAAADEPADVEQRPEAEPVAVNQPAAADDVEAPPIDAQSRLEPHIEAVSDAVSALEGDLCVASTRTEFDALFKRGQELAQRVATDVGLGPQERAAVEDHLRDILHRARADYDARRAQSAEGLRQARERVSLASDSLAEAQSVADVQEIRADLRLTREGLQTAGAGSARDDQAQTWSLWQATNQAAWGRLNELWTENEQALRTLLDAAQTDVEAGNPRAAKERIKSFHAMARTRECSHDAMKTLRRQAQQLWDDATRAAEQKHEAYLLVARRRLDHLRSLLGRSEQARARIEEDMRQLRDQLGRAQTDVAAALIRGQLEQREKEIRRFTAEGEVLARRIADTERSLG
jgi:hypothetical protein